MINDLVTDQRVHRIATYLHQQSCEVLVIGRHYKGNNHSALARPYRTYRFHMLFHKGKLFYIEYNLKLFIKLLFSPANTLVANDLDTLLPNYLVARFYRRRLIYDTHELFTEVPELIHRPFTQSIWKGLEQWIFPKLEQVMTVSKGIADYYTNRYHVPVSVIRNVPESYDPSPYRAKIYSEDRPKHPILLYQGALNTGRGIELMIDAMEYLPGFQLWIIGSGDIENALHLRVKSKNLEKQVQFKGRIAPDTLRLLTVQASIGMSLEEDLGLNYRFAAPNKLFDYIQAHVPVIVSNLQEMSQIVHQYQVGLILSERHAASLATLIQKTWDNQEQYQLFQYNCQKAALELNWEKESQALAEIYEL